MSGTGIEQILASSVLLAFIMAIVHWFHSIPWSFRMSIGSMAASFALMLVQCSFAPFLLLIGFIGLLVSSIHKVSV